MADVKIVCAPDSFKESMSAAQAARALARGIRRVLPDAECLEIPMADGGEGFAESLADALGLAPVEVPVLDAYGGRATARFAMAGGTAVMECAQAVGLGMIPPERRRIREATSFGVGQMILAALDGGARDLLVGVGGSATNDGGAGMLRALGARLLDADGRELDGSPSSLARLAAVDTAALDPRLSGVAVRVACDVDNPLLGARGASAVYGPQKGAAPRTSDSSTRRWPAWPPCAGTTPGSPWPRARAREAASATRSAPSSAGSCDPARTSSPRRWGSRTL